MKLAEIVQALDTIAPFAQAADWDNVGVIIGDVAQEVTKILVSNEVTPQVLGEAKASGCELLLSYHPPLLRGVNKLLPGGSSASLFAAAQSNIAIVSLHTAWDVAQGGVNDVLAHSAGLDKSQTTALKDGMGRMGTLRAPIEVDTLGKQVRERMRVSFALVAAATAGPASVRKIAVAAGAGDDFAETVQELGAEVFITGELRHHTTLSLLRAGIAVMCLTHCGSERASLGALCNALRAVLGHTAPSIALSRLDRAPWHLA